MEFSSQQRRDRIIKILGLESFLEYEKQQQELAEEDQVSEEVFHPISPDFNSQEQDMVQYCREVDDRDIHCLILARDPDKEQVIQDLVTFTEDPNNILTTTEMEHLEDWVKSLNYEVYVSEHENKICVECKRN